MSDNTQLPTNKKTGLIKDQLISLLSRASQVNLTTHNYALKISFSQTNIPVNNFLIQKWGNVEQSGILLPTFVPIQSKHQMSFVGNHTVKTDAKNRIAIPSSFRKLLAKSDETGFILQKDIYQNCLVLYPLSEWNTQLERLRHSLNPYNPKHKRFKSQFLRDTAEVSIDSGGRILLPKRLMSLVNITKEIEIAGADTTIEIWNKSEYDNYELDSEEFASLTEEILGGIDDIPISNES